MAQFIFSELTFKKRRVSQSGDLEGGFHNFKLYTHQAKEGHIGNQGGKWWNKSCQVQLQETDILIVKVIVDPCAMEHDVLLVQLFLHSQKYKSVFQIRGLF